MHSSSIRPTVTSDSLLVCLLRGYKMLLLLAFIGAAAGYALTSLTPVQWMSKMAIQPGQVAAATASDMQDRPIVPVPIILSRVNSPPFKMEVLQKMGLQDAGLNSAESVLIFETLQATASKADGLINWQVVALSPDVAKQALTVAFQILSEEHEHESGHSLQLLKLSLAQVSTDRERAASEYRRMYENLKTVPPAASGGIDAVLLSNVVVASARELHDLDQRKASLENALDPRHTYPTRKVFDAYVPSQPYAPRGLLYVLTGAAIGLILGMLLVLWRASRRGS